MSHAATIPDDKWLRLPGAAKKHLVSVASAPVSVCGRARPPHPRIEWRRATPGMGRCAFCVKAVDNIAAEIEALESSPPFHYHISQETNTR